MKIAVVGMWHLGIVSSAVFADIGHDVVALDEPAIIGNLLAGRFPVAEPGLPELVTSMREVRRLRFESDFSTLASADIVVFAYDTPVREDGSAAVDEVTEKIARNVAFMGESALAIVSSQLPVGSVAKLERRAAESGRADLRFACIPENLRLGKAIEYLRDIDRFVVGVRRTGDSEQIREMLAALTANLEVVGVESAEMIKHALNAFLATSVAFMNEVAGICEATGADAGEVERGLKSDVRIGQRAYLRPGGPYAGGTLARDINFLIDTERERGLEPRLFVGVRSANDYHAGWLVRRFSDVVGERRGQRVALLGLVYKPDTDTLRASSAVAFARWIAEGGGIAIGFDPAIGTQRPELDGIVEVVDSVDAALDGANLVVVATEWPQFREMAADRFLRAMREPVVFDPGRFLAGDLQSDPRIGYYAVGRGCPSQIPEQSHLAHSTAERA